MGKRFDSMVFPGGKSKACTLSYDDGVVQDRRLTEILRRHGIKATFNLGAGLLGHQDKGGFPGKPDLDISKSSPEEVKNLYAGHEVAGHGLYHSSLDSVGAPLASYEIVEDKRRLEQLVEKPLRMFAYPFGMYNSQVIEILRLAGYQGARTIRSSHSFAIPQGREVMNYYMPLQYGFDGILKLCDEKIAETMGEAGGDGDDSRDIEGLSAADAGDSLGDDEDEDTEDLHRVDAREADALAGHRGGEPAAEDGDDGGDEGQVKDEDEERR